MTETRTDAAEVQKIAEFDSIETHELDTFVQDANVIVDDRLDGLADEALLTLIEKWLAAHLASMREQRVSEEVVGNQEYVYEGSSRGMGLERTRYGQQVIDLDPTGAMEAGPHYVVTKHGDDTFEDYDTSESPNFGDT